MSGRAQTILSVDFNDRTNNIAPLTEPGFDPFFIIATDGSEAQTNASTRTFGPYTVTLTGNGTLPGYNDRERSNPTNSGAFTQSMLLRDFVFSTNLTVGSGLNLLLEGFTAGQVYQVTIWSYDYNSTGTPRVSDWTANGTLVRENYTFAGGQAGFPTNNQQYQFSFKVTADPSGQILIQGRRDAASGSNPSVFLNAFQVDIAAGDPPVPVIAPTGVEVYTGDNILFTSEVSGTPPFTYQWLKDGNPINDATNSRLTIFNTQVSDIATYSLAVSNLAGAATSGVAMITAILPVTSLAAGLVSHWPLDEADILTPDLTTNQNHLYLANMLPTNLLAGHLGNALAFDGVSQYAARTHTNSVDLPIYAYPAYAVAFWVKGDFTGQNDRRVFAEGATNSNNPLFSIGTHNAGTNGTVDVFIRNNNGVTPVDHRHSTQVAFDDNWHHIVWVDNNGYPRLYVDGVLDATDFNYVRGALTLHTTSIGGLLRATPGNYFGGTIDQVAVWRRSLSSTEVQQIFTSGPPAPLIIRSIMLSGGNVSISFQTPAPAAVHFVDQLDDIEGPTWVEVQNVSFSGSNNNLTAQFSLGPEPRRFYRVRY